VDGISDESFNVAVIEDLSPFAKVSVLLLSRTELMLSNHIASTTPSDTIRMLSELFWYA
jgi:hypothetical protein